jgi:hypothetical protein
MNEETLFEQARRLPPKERAAFLDRECPDLAPVMAMKPVR